MKKRCAPIVLSLIALLIAALACKFPIPSQPTETIEVFEPTPVVETEFVPTEVAPLPTVVEPATEPPTEPTPETPNAGQIAYIYGGNVWRYLVSTGEIVQVTLDGSAGSPETRYENPQFSPDGRYLAYTKNKISTIMDLVSVSLVDLSALGEFYKWSGTGYEFFAVRGDFECPAIENLEDQTLINFDILRYSLAALDSPEILGNIGGGLKFLTAISNDGQWASIVNCGCYSECGSASLWHLPTASTIILPADLYAGNIDFSPDRSRLTVSQQQMFGYIESPLYIANNDMSGLTPVFSEVNTAPTLALWSPDGEQLAFTAVSFGADDMETTESKVILSHPTGGGMFVVESGMADLIDWNPDGSKLFYRQTSGTSESFFNYEIVPGMKVPVPIMIDPYSSRNVDWGMIQ